MGIQILNEREENKVMAWLETLGRIPKILESNVNAILDKCQDPVKMSKQMLADYKVQVAKVRESLGELMADLENAKVNYDEAQKHVTALNMAAMRAVNANDRPAAELIVGEKQKAEVAASDYKAIYDDLLQKCNQMKAGYNKMIADIDILEQNARRTETKNNMAKAVEASNKVMASVNTSKINDSFAKMEQAADRRLAKANALREIDSAVSDADAVINKYMVGAGPDVSAEVDALFAAVEADKAAQSGSSQSFYFTGTMTSQ